MAKKKFFIASFIIKNQGIHFKLKKHQHVSPLRHWALFVPCHFNPVITYSVSKSSYIYHLFSVLQLPPTVSLRDPCELRTPESQETWAHSVEQSPIGNGCSSAIRFSDRKLATTKSCPPSILTACCHKSNLNISLLFSEGVSLCPRKHHENRWLYKAWTIDRREATMATSIIVIFRHDYESTAKANRLNLLQLLIPKQADVSFRQMLEKQTGCQAH